MLRKFAPLPLSRYLAQPSVAHVPSARRRAPQQHSLGTLTGLLARVKLSNINVAQMARMHVQTVEKAHRPI